VSDTTLTQVITELRQALGDNPRAPRIIEPVHGCGFRFVAEVRSLGDETGALMMTPPTMRRDAVPRSPG
jgi:DNA-binding winged helix-turn-helix (wHTH) protein